MAVVTINIPGPAMARVQQAYTRTFSYQVTVNDAPNPETPAQFTQRMIRAQIVGTVKSSEIQGIAETAIQAKVDEVDSTIVLT